MTQILTTKVLNDFITGQGYGVAPSAVEAMASELLASREAQPVAYIGAQMLEDLTDGARGCGRVWTSSKDVLSGDDRLALYTAPPAPAVPQAAKVGEMPFLGRGEPGYVRGWNDCRAAVLAQPVSSGYKLVPVEPTEEMISYAMGIPETAIAIYKRMLAAAPDGGK